MWHVILHAEVQVPEGGDNVEDGHGEQEQLAHQPRLGLPVLGPQVDG